MKGKGKGVADWSQGEGLLWPRGRLQERRRELAASPNLLCPRPSSTVHLSSWSPSPRKCWEQECAGHSFLTGDRRTKPLPLSYTSFLADWNGTDKKNARQTTNIPIVYCVLWLT